MTTKTAERWTYEGVTCYSDGKLGHMWRDEPGQIRVFTRTLHKLARPGAIYDLHVEHTGDGVSVSTGGDEKPVYFTTISDTEQLAMLQAKSRAAEAESREIKQAKADMNRDVVAEMLAPLKEEYRRRTRTGRRALLAVVLEEMTK